MSYLLGLVIGAAVVAAAFFAAIHALGGSFLGFILKYKPPK